MRQHRNASDTLPWFWSQNSTDFPHSKIDLVRLKINPPEAWKQKLLSPGTSEIQNPPYRCASKTCTTQLLRKYWKEPLSEIEGKQSNHAYRSHGREFCHLCSAQKPVSACICSVDRLLLLWAVDEQSSFPSEGFLTVKLESIYHPKVVLLPQRITIPVLQIQNEAGKMVELANIESP